MEVTFTNLLVLALLLEVTTNLVKNFAPAVSKRTSTPLVAGVLGAVLCFLTNTGVISATGVVISYPWLDYVLTGVVIARGAGLLNDLGKRLKG